MNNIFRNKEREIIVNIVKVTLEKWKSFEYLF